MHNGSSWQSLKEQRVYTDKTTYTYAWPNKDTPCHGTQPHLWLCWCVHAWIGQETSVHMSSSSTVITVTSPPAGTVQIPGLVLVLWWWICHSSREWTPPVQPFTGCLQLLHLPDTKCTVSCRKMATYMDVSLSLKDGKITTSVFSKHNHSYLPSSSCHFPVVFKGFVQGIGTRLHLVCSKDNDLNWRLVEYGRHVSDGSTKPLKRDLWKGQRKSKNKPAQEKKGKGNCMGEHLWPHSAVQSSCIFKKLF